MPHRKLAVGRTLRSQMSALIKTPSHREPQVQKENITALQRFTCQEISTKIRSFKNDKTSEPDGIPNEAIKVENRLAAYTEKEQPVEQAGFRRNYSTIDHIHSLEVVNRE
ncbi:hypothetical protein EVAR_24560_1, partial [Eumeta japonica]